MQENTIDFVILWVDGEEAAHRAKRQRFLRDDGQEKSASDVEQSTDDRRFIQSDELRYCLRSIKHHAPWYRNIFLVTDNQVPAFLDKTRLHEDRIIIIDHRVLFEGALDKLPTFNTRAIASMLDNIPGLSRSFIYGNDDFMLGSPVDESFFFDNNKPVIWGEWQEVDDAAQLTLFQQGMLNAAILEGQCADRYINISHGFQPLQIDIIRTLKKAHKAEFANNIEHKFRHRSQFLLESLHNHYCYHTLSMPVRGTEPMVHFSFELCRSGSEDKIRSLFDLFSTHQRHMFCLNEYQSLYPRISWVKKCLDELCGPPLNSEMM